MAEERKLCDALHAMYFSEINEVTVKDDAGQKIIQILGGVSQLLMDHLTSKEFTLNKQTISQLHAVLSAKHLHSQTNYISSELFPNFIDNDQYKAIFIAIQSTEPRLPSVIIKEIAEYGVGQIVQCENYHRCHQQFSVLHGDYLKSTQLRPDQQEWEICRDERALRAIKVIDYFQCSSCFGDDRKYFFCKQCIETYNSIDECVSCDKVCCSEGFQCEKCDVGWRACCDLCVKICPICNEKIGIKNDQGMHERCHPNIQCQECGDMFCPNLFHGGMCEFCPIDSITACDKCSLPHETMLIASRCIECDEQREAHTDCIGFQYGICRYCREYDADSKEEFEIYQRRCMTMQNEK